MISSASFAAEDVKEQPLKTGKKTEAGAKKDKKEKQKPRLQDSAECTKLADEVRTAIEDLGHCWRDTDCTTVSLGCPWQFSVCDQTIISTAEPEKGVALAKKIKAYDETCVQPDKAYAAACEEFRHRAEDRGCKTLEAMCINGRCRTMIDSILQDPDIGMKLEEKGRIAPDDIIKQKP